MTTGLSDPERDLLNSMRGFDEQDFHLKWALLPNLKIDTSWMDAHNFATLDAFRGKMGQKQGTDPWFFARGQYIKALAGVD